MGHVFNSQGEFRDSRTKNESYNITLPLHSEAQRSVESPKEMCEWKETECIVTIYSHKVATWVPDPSLDARVLLWKLTQDDTSDGGFHLKLVATRCHSCFSLSPLLFKLRAQWTRPVGLCNRFLMHLHCDVCRLLHGSGCNIIHPQRSAICSDWHSGPTLRVTI